MPAKHSFLAVSCSRMTQGSRRGIACDGRGDRCRAVQCTIQGGRSRALPPAVKITGMFVCARITMLHDAKPVILTRGPCFGRRGHGWLFPLIIPLTVVSLLSVYPPSNHHEKKTRQQMRLLQHPVTVLPTSHVSRGLF